MPGQTMWGFVVDKVELGHVYLSIFLVSFLVSFTNTPHSCFIHLPPTITTDSIIK